MKWLDRLLPAGRGQGRLRGAGRLDPAASALPDLAPVEAAEDTGGPSDATGLDDERVRRSPEVDHRTDPDANVTPLRPEPLAEFSPAPAAISEPAPSQPEFRELAPSQTPIGASDSKRAEGEDFLSPFDDELDIPTFLRRSAD